MLAFRSPLRSIVVSLLAAAALNAHGAELATPATQQGPPITVAAVSGGASVERLGERHPLQLSETVIERDVLHLDANAHLALRLAQGGILELGPRSELSLEKLASGIARKDRKSIFNLEHGFLRIVLTPADVDTPLYLYFSGQRASLGDGEYFFESAAAEAKVCVARGKLVATPITASKPRSLLATSCYRLANGEEPKSFARDSKTWDNLRRNFGLEIPTLTTAPMGDAPSQAPASPTPLMPAEADASHSSASAPAAASVTSVTSETGNGGNWAINIASYFDRAGADQQVELLRASGYAAFVQTALVDSRPRIMHRRGVLRRSKRRRNRCRC
jgi:hypothetical protein